MSKLPSKGCTVGSVTESPSRFRRIWTAKAHQQASGTIIAEPYKIIGVRPFDAEG
jgi:hypothetical protein